MKRQLAGASTRRRATGAAVCLVMAVGVVAGCASSPVSQKTAKGDDKADAVYAKAQSLTGQARLDYLTKEAKAEGGTLRLYTSYSGTTLPGIVKAFEDQYGIKVESYRGTPEDVATRVTNEEAAHYAKPADVIETRGFEMYRLSQAGLIRKVDGDFTDAFPADTKFEDWTADRVVLITLCWNTRKVAAADAPTSWEELAEPKWKGKLAIELLDDNWFQTLFTYLVDQGKSEKDVETYFRKVAANASVSKGHTTMQQLISAGQNEVGVDCYTYVTEQQKAKGAPVEWKPAVEPVVSQPNGVGVSTNAKHPAAAALLYQWILTDGQKILADTGNTVPTSPAGATTIPLDIVGYAKDVDHWSKLYDDVLQKKAS